MLLSRALKILTSTSVFLALNSAFAVIFSCLLYEVAISPTIVLVAFLATFSVYGLNKATDKTEDAVNRPEIASKSVNCYLIPSIIALIISLIIGAFEGIIVLLVIATPLIIGVIYSVKLAPSIPRLKEIVGVKSLTVAFSWALTGSLLPTAVQAVSIEKVALVFTYIFIQLIVNTILFDSLDIKGDQLSGVKTIPIVLGKSRTQKLLLTIQSMLWLWLAYCAFSGLFISCLPALIFGTIYGYGIIWAFLNKTSRRFYADLLIDGEWTSLLAILKISRISILNFI